MAAAIEGNYADPNHPAGFRMLKLDPHSWAAVIVGNDNAKVGVEWTLYGKVTASNGAT